MRARAAWRYKKRLAKLLRIAVVVCTSAVVLFPVYWMVVGTFQPPQFDLVWPPPYFLKGIDWRAFTSILMNRGFELWILHSLEVECVAVPATLTLSILGGYLLSRLRWRGSAAFGFLLLFTQLLPGGLIVVPELEWYRTLHWTNNLPALGLLYVAFTTPLGCWIMKGAFESVPNEVTDAALVDGCSLLGTLRSVLLPLSRSALVAVFVLTFYFAWNDYLFASVLITKAGLYTAGLGLSEFVGSGYPGMAAGLVFVIVPVVMFVAAQRHIARGLTAGALK